MNIIIFVLANHPDSLDSNSRVARKQLPSPQSETSRKGATQGQTLLGEGNKERQGMEWNISFLGNLRSQFGEVQWLETVKGRE